MRSLRPSNSASATKSMLQTSLMANAICLGCLSLAALFRLGRYPVVAVVHARVGDLLDPHL